MYSVEKGVGYRQRPRQVSPQFKLEIVMLQPLTHAKTIAGPCRVHQENEIVKSLDLAQVGLATRGHVIEARNLDLQAVNPHAKSDQDTHAPEELIDPIEAKGREVVEALAELRRLTAHA